MPARHYTWKREKEKEKALEDFRGSPRITKDEKRVLYHKHSVDIVGLMGFDAPSKPIFNLGKQGEASGTIPGDRRDFPDLQ
jgi:hypothetical protein